MGEAIESGRRRLFRGRKYDQYILAFTSRALTPSSAEDKATILRQNLAAAHSVCAEPRGQLHFEASPLSRRRCPAMDDSSPQTGRTHPGWLADASLPRSPVTSRLALARTPWEGVRHHKDSLKFRNCETRNSTIWQPPVLPLTDCSMTGFGFGPGFAEIFQIISQSHDFALPSAVSSAAASLLPHPLSRFETNPFPA